jgi:nucleoid-associated protein YgaU
MVTAQAQPPCTYTVQSGDTLFDIAQTYYGDGNQFQKIVDANKDQNVTPATLMVGSTLQIPAVQAQGAVTPPTSMTVGTTQTPAEPVQAQGPVMVTPQGKPPCTYTVQSGDTLFNIAQAYYGDGNQFQKIVDANKDQNVTPATLMAGSTLQIPA